MIAHEFFDFAQWVQSCATAAPPPNANCIRASCRSVTSRAYYGALHRAISLLDSIGIVIPANKHKHTVVPDIFQNSGDNQIIEIGDWLETLREQRNEADYQLNLAFHETTNFAGLRLRDAAKIIARIQTLAAGVGFRNSVIERAKIAMFARSQFLFFGPAPGGGTAAGS